MVNCGRWGAVLRRGRISVACALLVLGGVALIRHDARTPSVHSARLTPTVATSLLARLPLAFEPNVGQSAEPVKFLARGRGYGLFLTSKEAVLTLSGSGKGQAATSVRMQFANANAVSRLAASEKLPGHTNYFIGNNPSRWLRDVSQFERVRYSGLYPGIDLDFYGREGRLEYDFTVAPGADPHQIQLQFQGSNDTHLAANGDLVLSAAGRELRFQAPHIYQKSGNGQDVVAGNFVLLPNGRAGFQVGPYDRSRALVIDPVLTYSTYLGGSGDESCATIAGTSFVPHCPAVAVDSASRVYIAGATTSPGSSFPGAGPGLTLNGTADVFVARISVNSAGAIPALGVDYVTYLGATGTQYPTGIGVDSGFNVYVAGNTDSAQFPTANGLSGVPSSGNHAFVAKLDPGANLIYSTYIAGSGADSVSDLAVDSRGRAYVLGISSSSDLPTTPGALQPTYPAGVTNQFYFAKLDPAQIGANSLLYLTYFGGTTPTSGAVSGGGIAVDTNLNVYVAGGTTFTDMPVVNAYASTLKGGIDIWAAKLKAPTTNTQQYSLVYETYLGGTGDDVAYGVAAVDGTNSYITGSTTSTDFTIPTGTTAFQSTNGGGTDAFAARFGPPVVTGTTQGTVPLNYFSYLGGSGTDVGLGITVDSSQNVRITGLTTSGNTLNADPLPGVTGGGTDAFLARIATSSGSGSATSILGGSGTDIGTSLATDVSLNNYVVGETNSGNFPTAASAGQPQVTAVQTSLSGPSDAFVSKLGPTISGLTLTCPVGAVVNGSTVTACSPAAPTASPSPVGVGNQVKFTYPIYNTGDPVVGAVFTSSVQGTTSTINSASGSGCASSNSAANGSFTCNLGTLNTSGVSTSGSTTTLTSTSSVQITVTPTAPTPPLVSTTTIGNSGVLNIAGSSFQATLGQQAQVNDFNVQAAPATQTVTAGNQATYTVTVTPTGIFPNSVSLGPCTGLPAGASCTFAQNPIPNLNNLAQNRTMEITTTARVTTPASLFRHSDIFYGFWLPISGLAFVGAGVTRKRRWVMGLIIAAALAVMLLQSGCSNYRSNTKTVAGTPAGTYTVTIGATSGTANRSTTVTLVVQ